MEIVPKWLQLSEPQFIGWIPSINGELLFKFSNTMLGFGDLCLVNTCNPNDRYNRIVIASSLVDWQDKIEPGEQSRDFKGIYRVVLLARSNDRIKKTAVPGLIGSIFILYKPTLRFLSGERELVFHLHALHNRFDPRNGDGRNLNTVREEYSALSGELERLFASAAKLNGDPYTQINVVSFQTHPTGVSFFRYDRDSRNTFGEKDLESYEKDDPVRINSRTIVRQAFYYLKSLFHEHKHHFSGDSLTRVHGYRGNTDTFRQNARLLIRDLKHGLVDTKRAQIAPHEGQEMMVRFLGSGIACYGKSLVETCERAGLLDQHRDVKRFVERERNYFENAKESIQISSRSFTTKGAIFRVLQTSRALVALVSFVFAPYIVTKFIRFQEAAPEGHYLPLHWSFVTGSIILWFVVTGIFIAGKPIRLQPSVLTLKIWRVFRFRFRSTRRLWLTWGVMGIGRYLHESSKDRRWYQSASWRLVSKVAASLMFGAGLLILIFWLYTWVYGFSLTPR